MSKRNNTGGKLFLAAVAALVLAALLSQGGVAVAGDREDAKALVGYWQYQGILGDNFELKADGRRLINGLTTEWTVKNGKFVITNLIGVDKAYDFTLSPDGNTLKLDGETYKRQ